jgi:hypothetical protein
MTETTRPQPTPRIRPDRRSDRDAVPVRRQRSRCDRFYVDAFGAVEHHRMVGDDAASVMPRSSSATAGSCSPTSTWAGVLAPTTTAELHQLSPTTPGAPPSTRSSAERFELGDRAPPVADQFWSPGHLLDPFGHQWSISAPIEDFDDDRYDANSRDAGFEIVRPEREPIEGDHQVKHHEVGDLFYFTLPVADLARAQAFFSAVLGWRFDDPSNGHVGNISAPPGGVEPTTEPAPPRLWFVVDDIDAAVARVRELGGTATEPVRYDSGWDAACTDDQGTPFHLSVPAAKYTR